VTAVVVSKRSHFLGARSASSPTGSRWNFSRTLWARDGAEVLTEVAARYAEHAC
jgi:hypothetical protein